MEFAFRFVVFSIPVLAMVIFAPEKWRRFNRRFVVCFFIYTAVVFGVPSL